MKCLTMRHFIWVFNVCQSTHLGVTRQVYKGLIPRPSVFCPSSLSIVLYGLSSLIHSTTVKPVLISHSKRTQKLVFRTDYCLMQAKSIAECSKGSILQYFRPSLSYHFSLRHLFCLFLSGRLRQILLYFKTQPSMHVSHR